MVSILQKAHTLNALCVNYKDAFRMGTTGGSKSLDLPVGQLVPGRAADLVGISLKDLSMQPLSRSEQFLPNMVYSLQPTAIRRVMINGRVTVDNGRLQLLEDRQLLEQIQATMAYLEA